MAKSNLNGYTRARGEFLLSHSKWTGRYFKSSEDIKKHDPGKDWSIATPDRWQYNWGSNLIFYALWEPQLRKGPALFQTVVNSGIDMVAHLLEFSGKEGQAPQDVIDNNFCEEMFVPLHTQEAQEIYEDEELDAYFEELKPAKKSRPKPKDKKIECTLPEGWFLTSEKAPPKTTEYILVSEYADGRNPIEARWEPDYCANPGGDSRSNCAPCWIDGEQGYPMEEPYAWSYTLDAQGDPVQEIKQNLEQLLPTPSTPILVSATGTIELINKNSSQILNLKPDVKIKN